MSEARTWENRAATAKIPEASVLMSAPDTSHRLPLIVPQMGVVEEVVVIEWLVAAGSAVAEGQEVVIVETEKAEVALESPASGTIEIVAPASDDEVPVGATLAYIDP